MTVRPPRRILLTNVRLDGRSGTEIVTLETARGLISRGHCVAVYATSALGGVAREMSQSGAIVTNRIEALEGFNPDIVQGNHSTPFLTVRALFPDCPALWFCHDAFSWHDEPAVLPGTAFFVAHSPTIKARLLTVPGITEDRIAMLPNATGLEPAEGPPPARLRRVLVVAKYHAKYVSPILEACRRLDLAVEMVGGGVGEVANDLVGRMLAADLVVASGKAAMEAIVLNRPVLCADERGLAGLVTHDVASAWFMRNFGGSLLRQRVETDSVMAEIGLYDPEDFARMRERILERLLMCRYLDELEALHDRVLAHRFEPDRTAFAAALEAAMPNYRPGGHYPFQAYDLKRKAETQAAELARELSTLRLSQFDFGPGPDFGKLEFTTGAAGATLLDTGWRDGSWLPVQDRGLLVLPVTTGWSRGRGFKVEGTLALPETATLPGGTLLPIAVRVDGQPVDIHTTPEYCGRRRGYVYFWFDSPPGTDPKADITLEFAHQGSDGTQSSASTPGFFRLDGLTLARRLAA